MDDLRDALVRTRSKPLRAALESAQTRNGRRQGSATTFRSWQGPWERGVRYLVADVVSHLGSSWRCLVSHIDIEPPSPAWEIVALRGESGPSGARGLIGPQGPPGPGGGGHVIEDEGVPLAQRADLNFVGAGVTATDAGGKTVVTIPGGGSGTVDFLGIEKWSIV